MIRRPTAVACLTSAFVVLAGCTADDEGASAGDASAAAFEMPVTTSSEEAKRHFLLGLHELDMGRVPEARSHLSEAVALDSGFAIAHRYRAFVMPSTEASMAAIAEASRHKASASEAEQTLIGITEAAIESDAERQLTLARELTEAEPGSPRAWLQLAGVLAGMDRTAEEREAIGRAIEADSTFAPAYMQLGNSLLFAEPIDRAAAQRAFERAVELEPGEGTPHDLLGDAYRMRGQLEQAAAEYSRVSELEPENALALQQRGHVHSFLGNWEQARADYDSAIAMGEDDEPATFAVYRAFVNVHEGNPQAAIEELEALIGRIDDMDLPDPRGPKIFALTSQAQIALHVGALDIAERALERRAVLVRANAEALGTEQARRTSEASLALWQARLAARSGDFERARSLVDEAMQRVEPINDPTRNQGAHQVAGLIHLLQENFEESANHYAQGDPDDIYATYHHALALEGAGRTEEAQALFEKVANWRFNALGLALTRDEARKKLASS